jgi:YggT family protein
MIRLLFFIDGLLGLYVMILLVTVIISWLVAFDVINVRNNFVRSVVYALSALTDPLLNPLRKVIPPVGGLDLTFLVLLVLIQLVRSVIIPDMVDLFQ